MSEIAFTTELDLGNGVKFSLHVSAGEPQALLHIKSSSGNEIITPLEKNAVLYLRKHLGLINSYMNHTRPTNIRQMRKRLRRRWS